MSSRLTTVKPAQGKRLLHAILQNDFPSFTRKVFETTSPGHQYIHNWHVDCMCEYLRACELGQISDLVINIPPRCMKTTVVSIAWSAWLLGKQPTAQIIGASYSQNLAFKDNLAVRDVIMSEWYQAIFPSTALKPDQNEKRKFSTAKQGGRVATSVGGTLTGEGGDFLVLDDPIKPEDAISDVVRQSTNDWIDMTFMTRKNDPKTSVAVLIMQRLHEDDPSGHLLDKGWEHLSLPAKFDERKIINIGERRFEAKEGELLFPERIGQDELDKLAGQMGAFAFACQYMQAPAPLEGGLVKKQWLRFYENRPLNFHKVIHSWDTAVKPGELNDYSACTVWGMRPEGPYLVDVINKRLDYPSLKDQVIKLADKYPPDYILIEDKATGQALIQELQASTQLPIIAINPTRDKVTRLATVSPKFETGSVYLDAHALWLDDYVDQLTIFPNSKHDDMVDSTSQFLQWLKGRPDLERGKKVGRGVSAYETRHQGNNLLA